MIKVKASSNVKRAEDLFPVSTTLRDCLNSLGMDCSRGLLHMDSAPINPGDMNKTFEELGYDGTPGKNACFLSLVVKADNA